MAWKGSKRLVDAAALTLIVLVSLAGPAQTTSGPLQPSEKKSLRRGVLVLASLFLIAGLGVGGVGWSMWNGDRGTPGRPEVAGGLILFVDDPSAEASVDLLVVTPTRQAPGVRISVDFNGGIEDVAVDDDRPFRTISWAIIASGSYGFTPFCTNSTDTSSLQVDQTPKTCDGPAPASFRSIDEPAFHGVALGRRVDVTFPSLYDESSAVLAFGTVSTEQGVFYNADGSSSRRFPQIVIDGNLNRAVANRVAGQEIGAIPPIAATAEFFFSGVDEDAEPFLGSANGGVVFDLPSAAPGLQLVGAAERNVTVGPLNIGDVVAATSPDPESIRSQIDWRSEGLDTPAFYSWQFQNELTRDRIQQKAFLAAFLMGLAGTMLAGLALHFIPSRLRRG